jgi:hypothetical protein
MEREQGGARKTKSPPRGSVSWRDRDDVVPERSTETLNRTFSSERAKMASPLPPGSLVWESKNVPNTPLDPTREQQFREEAIRMLRGDSEKVRSPLQAAASGQTLSRSGSERVSREVYDAALKRAVDQAGSEEHSGKGMRKS